MKNLSADEIEKTEKNFLTASEAARALGISLNTFYRKNGEMNFPVRRIGRKYIIPKKPFLDFLRGERSGIYG
ncbi:MAG: helix-turn-helix domain-containing protein [Ruminococcus sp.]|nr:helix-turn-helix domain-containing protein [Ruminococcus sp.]